MLISCRSVSVAQRVEHEFGPVQITLYAELTEATHGWLGDSPVPEKIQAVDIDNSANFEDLDKALTEAIHANAGGQRKGVSAVVIGRQVERHGYPVIKILSSRDVQVVDLPADLYAIWRATVPPPN
jgi:hypothetical protein